MVAEEMQAIQTVGRRKTAVARVLIRPGAGEWTINGRPIAETARPRIRLVTTMRRMIASWAAASGESRYWWETDSPA